MENNEQTNGGGAVFARLFKLQTGVNRLILEGKRNPVIVAKYFQDVLDGKVALTHRGQESKKKVLLSPKKQKPGHLPAWTKSCYRLYPTRFTNLEQAVIDAQRFAKNVLGVDVDLSKQFNFPTTLPWKDVMVIYDPGFDNQKAVDKALRGQKLDVFEESPVNEYSGSMAHSHPTVHIIENSLHPTEDTLGEKAKSPEQLKADGRNYLTLRGYAFAFGLHYFIHDDYLDQKTWTWFPENRLPSGGVACGFWNPGGRRVEFGWGWSGNVCANDGARLAISVPLKT